WEYDLYTDKVTWSDETFRILGFQPGEVEPSQDVFFSKIVDEDLAEAKRVYELSNKGQKPYSFVHRIIRSNGEVRILRTESKPLINKNGSFEGSYGIFEDITEKRLVASENDRLSNIIQKSLNEIYMFNSDTHRFEYVNEGALRNLGYTLDEMLQMTPQDIIPKYTPSKFKRLVE